MIPFRVSGCQSGATLSLHPGDIWRSMRVVHIKAMARSEIAERRFLLIRSMCPIPSPISLSFLLANLVFTTSISFCFSSCQCACGAASESIQDVFERARQRGSEQETAIANNEEVKKSFSLQLRATTHAPWRFRRSRYVGLRVLVAPCLASRTPCSLCKAREQNISPLSRLRAYPLYEAALSVRHVRHGS
ncbi:hypothetical protein K503DRAFT_502591 [Rhizopogon vinicolor AM-OR11-026]|uniref:Uncharacterized protein n=1 Tax=Rhizopogon vinicolor AM-OR11-026 TaxID=1314800 RepID=A0A1B7N971_9AGAM|nr:hypothetical protein K503DRAFT_502591 [Rhizopogon vinicolor AM-OR11-026]